MEHNLPRVAWVGRVGGVGGGCASRLLPSCTEGTVGSVRSSCTFRGASGPRACIGEASGSRREKLA